MKSNRILKHFSITSALLLLGLVIANSVTQTTAIANEDLFPQVSISVSATGSTANETIWILPGPRSLDPAIFGTPDNPLKTNLLPEVMRNTTLDNSTYTTTAGMTPFSNNTKSISGSFDLTVKDVTPLDDPNSLDEATLESNFTDPMGLTEYYIKLESLIKVGPDHPFFGGVGLNVLMHGMTEIGTPLMPTSFSYITLWGFGDLYINGTLKDSKRLIHVMVSERLRDNDFTLGSQVFDSDSLEIHLILPNTKITPTGPITDSVPTEFMLPNGMTQPFFHVNFYNIQLDRQNSTETSTIFSTTTITDQNTDTTTVTTPGFTNIVTIVAIFSAIPIIVFLRRKK